MLAQDADVAPPVEAQAAASAPAPLPPVEDVWQYTPAAKQRARKWPWVALGAAAAVACVGLGVVGVIAYSTLTKPAQTLVAQPDAPPVAVPPQQTPPIAQQPAPSSVPAPAPTPPAVAPQPPMVIAKHVPRGKAKAPEDNVGPSLPKVAKSDAGGDGFDDLLGGKKKMAANADLKPTLSRDDVLGTIKANAPSITKCADAYARAGGVLPAKVVVKWVIKPSGLTEGQEMATPELKGTSMDACVLAAVRKWKFPEFQSGPIPVTFPFALAQ
jgi:hypothetical protein